MLFLIPRGRNGVLFYPFIHGIYFLYNIYYRIFLLINLLQIFHNPFELVTQLTLVQLHFVCVCDWKVTNRFQGQAWPHSSQNFAWNDVRLGNMTVVFFQSSIHFCACLSHTSIPQQEGTFKVASGEGTTTRICRLLFFNLKNCFN